MRGTIGYRIGIICFSLFLAGCASELYTVERKWIDENTRYMITVSGVGWKKQRCARDMDGDGIEGKTRYSRAGVVEIELDGDKFIPCHP